MLLEARDFGRENGLMANSRITAIYLDSGKRVEVQEIRQDPNNRAGGFIVRTGPKTALVIPSDKIQSIEVTYEEAKDLDEALV